jgi:hypothetical protein
MVHVNMVATVVAGLASNWQLTCTTLVAYAAKKLVLCLELEPLDNHVLWYHVGRCCQRRCALHAVHACRYIRTINTTPIVAVSAETAAGAAAVQIAAGQCNGCTAVDTATTPSDESTVERLSSCLTVMELASMVQPPALKH